MIKFTSKSDYDANKPLFYVHTSKGTTELHVSFDDLEDAMVAAIGMVQMIGAREDAVAEVYDVDPTAAHEETSYAMVRYAWNFDRDAVVSHVRVASDSDAYEEMQTKVRGVTVLQRNRRTLSELQDEDMSM